jgi:Cu/Ag efflux pump CusA
MLPLVWSQGAAAKGNHSIGISTVGGMFTGVVLGIFIIPVMYVIFQYLHEKMPSRKRRRLLKQKEQEELLATAH